jgi:hypothetical protein
MTSQLRLILLLDGYFTLAAELTGLTSTSMSPNDWPHDASCSHPNASVPTLATQISLSVLAFSSGYFYIIIVGTITR